MRRLRFNRRGGRIRTYDLLLPKQARYRATLHPEKKLRPTFRPKLRAQIYKLFRYQQEKNWNSILYAKVKKQNCHSKIRVEFTKFPIFETYTHSIL